jgi:adenosylmethionine-8-amino-7-oxononanoate aminotransferase
VALKSLDLFESDNLLAELQPKIFTLAERLEKFSSLEHVGDIRHCGMAAGIELVGDKASRLTYPWKQRIGVQVCLEARKHGIFSRPLGNTVVVYPPLVISDMELEFLLDGLQRSIQAVTESQRFV